MDAVLSSGEATGIARTSTVRHQHQARVTCLTIQATAPIILASSTGVRCASDTGVASTLVRGCQVPWGRSTNRESQRRVDHGPRCTRTTRKSSGGTRCRLTLYQCDETISASMQSRKIPRRPRRLGGTSTSTGSRTIRARVRGRKSDGPRTRARNDKRKSAVAAPAGDQESRMMKAERPCRAHRESVGALLTGATCQIRAIGRWGANRATVAD